MGASGEGRLCAFLGQACRGENTEKVIDVLIKLFCRYLNIIHLRFDLIMIQHVDTKAINKLKFDENKFNTILYMDYIRFCSKSRFAWNHTADGTGSIVTMTAVYPKI